MKFIAFFMLVVLIIVFGLILYAILEEKFESALKSVEEEPHKCRKCKKIISESRCLDFEGLCSKCE